MTMARLKFRLTCITLDEEEDPKDVAAVVDSDAYEVITGFLGKVTTTDTRRGGTEMAIVIPIANASKLFHECGKLNGLDPRYGKGSGEIYDSLTMVFYGIMGE
jgi:hypothetical protein